MSSRVLRKLGLSGDRDLNSIGDEGSDTEADFSNSSEAKKKKLNINRYDLLNQLSHSESEVKEDDDHETAGSLNAQDGAVDIKDASRRKKKKKKKKPGKSSSVNARSSEDNIEDEVERSVREVNEILGEVKVGQIGVGDVAGSLKRSILSIELRMLNPNNELRRIFGSKVIQSEPVKKRGRGRGYLRTSWLVSQKENWPQVGKPGISMKLLETKNGILYFTYEHNMNYQQVQMKFLEAVESLNPDHIIELLNSHPYHVDALLQLCEIFRLSEDLNLAANLVERALYCLECAFHPAFSLATGNCRLDYKRQENRALYVALLKHVLFVGSRACYRTALEFCKVILSLDPEGDPLAIVLALDFYAIKAHEYSWLIRIANEWEPTKNLSQLPNFAYSLALAHFYLGEEEAAEAALVKALISFPGVLRLLLDKCSIQPDPAVEASTFFAYAPDKQTIGLNKLEALYIARSHHCWKDSTLFGMMERSCKAALALVAANHPSVIEAARNRATNYPKIPLNISRHLIISDFSDVTPIVDEAIETMTTPVFGFDPLPPPDSINLYSRPAQRTGTDSSSPLAVFFRSIMPNYNLNQVALDLMGEDGEAEAGGNGLDLRRNVVSLIDAMRDLLSNIDFPDIPGDGDNEDDPDSDQENTP